MLGAVGRIGRVGQPPASLKLGPVFQGLDLDFVRGRYALNSPYRASPSDLSGWSYSRTGPGVAETAAGALAQFAAGAPRITDRGLLVESTRTETAGNNTFAGVSPGPLSFGVPVGAGGFLVFAGAKGLAASIVEVGAQDGIPFVDVRVQGTPATSPQFGLEYQTQPLSPLASAGQAWTNSVYLARLAGSWAGVDAITLRAYERPVTGPTLDTRQGPNIRDAIASSLRRFSAVHTLLNANTGRTTGLFAVTGSGTAVDYTLRIGLPSFQLGGALRSPVLTSGATLSIGDDLPSVPYNFGPGDQCTLIFEGDHSPLGAVGNVGGVGLDDGTQNNRVYSRANNLNGSPTRTIVSGGTILLNDGGGSVAIPAGTSFRQALAVHPDGGLTLVSDGVIRAGKSAPAAIPSMNRLAFGGSLLATGNQNGYARRIRALPQAVSDDDLRALTSPANDWAELQSYLASLDDALMLDLADTDWMRTTSVGPTLPVAVNDTLGLALSRRLLGQNALLSRYLDSQPELSANLRDASGTTAGMTTAADSVITIVDDATSPAASGKAFRLANVQAGNRFADVQTTGVVAGRTYQIEFWAKGNDARGETVGLAGSGAPNAAINLTTAWQRFSFIFTANTNGQAAYIRASAGKTTDFVLNSVKEVSRTAALQATPNVQPRWQAHRGARFDGSDDRFETGYRPGATRNFIVARANIQATVGSVAILAGSRSAVGDGRMFLAISGDAGGRAAGGVGTQNHATIFGGPPILGRDVVLGITQDGSTVRVFVDREQVYSGPQSGPVDPNVAMMVGAASTGGTAGFFCSSDIRRLVAGHDFIDLDRFRWIASRL